MFLFADMKTKIILMYDIKTYIYLSTADISGSEMFNSSLFNKMSFKEFY